MWTANGHHGGDQREANPCCNESSDYTAKGVREELLGGGKLAQRSISRPEQHLYLLINDIFFATCDSMLTGALAIAYSS